MSVMSLCYVFVSGFRRDRVRESGCRLNHLLGLPALVQKKIMNFYLVINYCQSGHTLAREKKLLRRKGEKKSYFILLLHINLGDGVGCAHSMIAAKTWGGESVLALINIGCAITKVLRLTKITDKIPTV